MAAGKTIAALTKVRLSYLIKRRYSSRSLSSAAERLDFSLPDSHHSESPNYWRNPNDVHHSINPSYEVGKNTVGCMNSGGYNVQNPSFGGYVGGNGNIQSYSNGSNHWSVQGNREGYGGGYQGRAAGQNANSAELYNQNDHPSSFQQNLGAGQQHYQSGFREMNPNTSSASENYMQNPPIAQPPQYNGTYQNGPIANLQNIQSPQNFNSGSYPMNVPNYGDESSEVSENTGYIGSLEEFDRLCNEKKMNEIMEVLLLLERNGIAVNLPRYLQLIHLCGETKSLEEAKTVHEHIMRHLSPINVYTNNRILEMYSKCGSMDNAVAVFDKMPERNLSSWDIMIKWLSKNGLGEDAINLFTRFKEEGLKPDGEMFVSVFLACAVVGDVREGKLHFESMTKDYGIVPSMDQYVSFVDMLGRAGHLEEALDFVEKMPIEPSLEVWETLMNLSRVHGDTVLGDRCAELVEKLDPSRLDCQSKSGLVPALAATDFTEPTKKNLLEARTTVYEYRAGDKSHPETERIYAQLRQLKILMKEAGYVPETRVVLHDVDQESKEEALLAHSERLAVSSGLLTSPARAQIRIIKNLRVCVDCHNALKIMSKIVGREFVMRDAKRFHHMKDGVCSCRDYW